MCILYYTVILIEMAEISSMAATPKTWTKVNMTPATAKVLKRVALDREVYIYQILDEMVKEKYPNYFDKKKVIKQT